MRSMFSTLATLIALAHAATAVAVWGQCGGQNWSGATTCDAGSACVVVNSCASGRPRLRTRG
jgi:hypothetical protein